MACKHVRGISNALEQCLTCNVLRSYRICSCSEYVGQNHILATKMGNCSLKEKGMGCLKKIYVKVDKVFINYLYLSKSRRFFMSY